MCFKSSFDARVALWIRMYSAVTVQFVREFLMQVWLCSSVGRASA